MGRLSMLFAGRYMRSRKSLSVINIISRVSIFAVGVPVAAMVILLSVFNGFDSLVKSMYTAFDADILITPAQGKVFAEEEFGDERLAAVQGVEAFSHILEESVMLEYRGRQALAKLRGVDEGYTEVVPILGLVATGTYRLGDGELGQAVLGQGLAYNLAARVNFDVLRAYVPRRGQFSSLLPISALSTGEMNTSGIFVLDADTDGTYAITSIEFMRELLEYGGRSSGVMVKLAPGVKPDGVKAAIEKAVGKEYTVQTRYEQKSAMYNILKYEKWGIFFIIFLVLVIASFSIIGSLVMLIIDKRPDIRILITMGGGIGFVRQIFVNEGMLIGCIGTAAGVSVGMLVCWLQQEFGFVRLGGRTFLVDAYPVVIQPGDILAVVAATLAVTWIITKFTVSRMIPKSDIRP